MKNTPRPLATCQPALLSGGMSVCTSDVHGALPLFMWDAYIYMGGFPKAKKMCDSNHVRPSLSLSSLY